jgi:hypothetical protein
MRYLVPFILLWAFVGCETLNPENEQREAQLVQRAFELGVKLGVYKGAQQNPELIPLAKAIANVLDSTHNTEGLLDLIETELIPRYVDDPADQLIANEIVLTFADLFRAEIDEQFRGAYLPVLAENIRSGIRYAELNPDGE